MDPEYAYEASPGPGDPTMIVTLDRKRRLTVPVALAPAAPGERFDARFDEEEDAIVFRRVKAKRPWLEILKACPASMDDLPPRSREYLRKRRA
jgi:hypothetical protein